jgi:branched-chain amino acid transport system ATP-binding protein
VAPPLRKGRLNHPSSSSLTGELLEAHDLRVHFAGVKAVDGVDIVLRRGEILGLIGPNGAGKTTVVNALSGFQKLTAGTVSIGGRDVTGWPPHRLARVGLGRSFQSMRLFANMTVFENVELGGVGVGIRRVAARAYALEILERLGLAGKVEMQARALPFGDERRLGIARALAMKPGFLLLDEPGAGLNDVESEELMRVITSIRNDLGCGLLVIEHDMRLIMGVCERIQVLDHGRTISSGSPAEIQTDPTVIEAYLGTRRSKRVARA